MATYLLRVELPDRPGALGAVASRIGAVRADVVAVDIVGRGQGRAVDEFIVEIADEDHVPLMLSEISEVDGISIQALHSLPEGYRDGRLDVYDTAVALLREHTPHGALNAIATRARRELDASWTALLDAEEHAVLASSGRPPAAHWLAAYIESARLAVADAARDEAERTGQTPSVAEENPDVAWVDLAAWDLVLIAGRSVRPFGRYDRQRLAALARVADARWADLAERDSRLSHPSRTTVTELPRQTPLPASAPAPSPAPAP
ncbi:MAG TPA: ACT domain-containing protein [Acidimicrobiales bacterium]|nr:ACT domain-containing protein [Acidimicrobiales bacterium]